jgi:AraC-like DNA-binding protein
VNSPYRFENVTAEQAQASAETLWNAGYRIRNCYATPSGFTLFAEMRQNFRAKPIPKPERKVEVDWVAVVEQLPGQGTTLAEIAQVLGVSRSTVDRLLRRERGYGTPARVKEAAK